LNVTQPFALNVTPINPGECILLIQPSDSDPRAMIDVTGLSSIVNNGLTFSNESPI